MTATFPVKLTQLESLYLSDALSMFTQGPPDATSGQGAPYPNLLMKIGGAVLEADQQKAPVTVRLTNHELWTIREVAKSSVVVGSEKVGLNLLMKAYQGILALAAESDMESVVDDLGEVVDTEPGKSQYAARFERFSQQRDLETGGGPSDDGQDENGRNGKSGDADKD